MGLKYTDGNITLLDKIGQQNLLETVKYIPKSTENLFILFRIF